SRRRTRPSPARPCPARCPICEDERMSTGGNALREFRWRRLWWLAAVLGVALLAAAVWVGWKGSVAYVGLRDAQGAATKARDAIGKGDAIEGARQLTVMTSDMARAREATQDTLWKA